MESVCFRLPPLRDQRGQIFFGVPESSIGSEEAKSAVTVRLDQLSNSPTENGANQDIRVENNHFDPLRVFLPLRRAARNSVTNSSSLICESASASRSAAALSSAASVMSRRRRG